MRVVLDTNVIISGLINESGAPAKIIDLWIDGIIDIFTSPHLIEETLNVIIRPKFKSLGSTDDRFDVINKLFSVAEIVIADQSLEIIKNDSADNRVLECALVAAAEFIVTGDKHLLDLISYEGIKIVTPGEFLKSLN